MSDYDKLNHWYKQQADRDFCVVFFMLFYSPILVAGLLAYLASQGYFK